MWRGCGRFREQARSHLVKCIAPVGAGLAGDERCRGVPAGSGLRVHPIQRPVDRQLGEHDDLLNRQRGAALRAAPVDRRKLPARALAEARDSQAWASRVSVSTFGWTMKHRAGAGRGFAGSGLR
jgi:hypothetical protein